MKYYYLKFNDQICPTEIDVEIKDRESEGEVDELYYEDLDSDQASDQLTVLDKAGLKTLIKKCQRALTEEK